MIQKFKLFLLYDSIEVKVTLFSIIYVNAVAGAFLPSLFATIHKPAHEINLFLRLGSPAV